MGVCSDVAAGVAEGVPDCGDMAVGVGTGVRVGNVVGAGVGVGTPGAGAGVAVGICRTTVGMNNTVGCGVGDIGVTGVGVGVTDCMVGCAGVGDMVMTGTGVGENVAADMGVCVAMLLAVGSTDEAGWGVAVAASGTDAAVATTVG